MRTFTLSKIAVPLHLAFIVAYLAAVRIAPGEVMAYLPVVWMVLGLLVVAVLFPAAHRGEDVEGARKRSFLSFRKDYASFFGFCGLCFVLFQTLNGPRTLQLNTKTLLWEFSQARVRDFPSCFDQLLSLDGAFGVLLVISAILVIRNSLGRNGRNYLLRAIVAISAVLSLYGLVALALFPAEDLPAGFATITSPVAAGFYFMMVFSVTCGLLTMELGEKHPSRKKTRFLFFSAILIFFGAVFSLSALALGLVCLVLIANLVYGLLFLRERALAEKKMRFFAIGIVLVAIVAFLHFIAYSSNPIHERLSKIFRGPWMTEAEKAETSTLRTVAWRTFADNPFAGVGTWGYSDPDSFARYVKSQDEWQTLSDQGKRYYHCGDDPLQCLAEYGLLGGLFLAIPFLGLIGGILRRGLYAANKSNPISRKADDDEEEDFFDRFSPLAFSLFLAVVVAGGFSFYFSIFRQPLVLVVWTIFLTCLYCFLPKPLPHEEGHSHARRLSFRFRYQRSRSQDVVAKNED